VLGLDQKLDAARDARGPPGEGQQGVGYDPFAKPTMNARFLRGADGRCRPLTGQRAVKRGSSPSWRGHYVKLI
jgi:hypothetical protein